MAVSRGDIDGIYNAIRPRLKKLINGDGVSTIVTVVPPHAHSASQTTFEPEGRIEAEDCQASQVELDDEKLARDGSQTMLGTLQMNSNPVTGVWNLTMSGSTGNAIISAVRRITMTGLGLIELVTTITMAGVGLIEAVRKIDFTGSGEGQGIIDQPRVIHMDGDDDNDEARIDGLERLVFNDEVTKSVIENPSRAEWNTDVTPGSDFTNAAGMQAWSDVEATLVVVVVSGAA